jgi:hypothetical protein
VCTGANPVTCTALDECHGVGVCNPLTGCTNPSLPDGTPCNDGSACTTGEACHAGACGQPTTTVACTASDQCHKAGVCDPATGNCSNPQKPDGTACDDGLACTSLDECQAGVCTPGSSACQCATDADCHPMDQCHVAGTCDPTTRTCSNPAVSDGTVCNDGSACTTGETCQAGVCGAPTSTVTCTAQDQCHDPGTCDPATGACSNPVSPEGTSCDDGRACTTGDACHAGACTPLVNTCACNSDADCTALDQCHLAGQCDPVTSICSNPLKPDGAACDDANPCTAGESCQAGVCGSPVMTVECTPLDQCHVAGTCDVGTGLCSDPIAAEGTTCSDDRVCTTGDSCRSGVCTPTTNSCTCTSNADCPTLDQCHLNGTCDLTTGLCGYAEVADNTACNDHNACTSGETCQAGVCGSGTSVTCTPQDDCHVAGVCDTTTGECTNPAKADGSPCATGICLGGGCVAQQDAGLPDAGFPEAGTPDAGLTDGPGPTVDLGAMDAASVNDGAVPPDATADGPHANPPSSGCCRTAGAAPAPTWLGLLALVLVPVLRRGRRR